MTQAGPATNVDGDGPSGERVPTKVVRSSAQRDVKPLQTRLEHVVDDGERDPCMSCAALAEALAGSNRDAVLEEECLGCELLGEAEPDEERSFALHIDVVQFRQHTISATLVRRPAFVDRLLRPGQRRDSFFPTRTENAREHVVLELFA